MIIAFLIGLALGITLTCAGFIYVNRKRPDSLDSAEGVIRKL